MSRRNIGEQRILAVGCTNKNRARGTGSAVRMLFFMIVFRRAAARCAISCAVAVSFNRSKSAARSTIAFQVKTLS